MTKEMPREIYYDGGCTSLEQNAEYPFEKTETYTRKDIADELAAALDGVLKWLDVEKEGDNVHGDLAKARAALAKYRGEIA